MNHKKELLTSIWVEKPLKTTERIEATADTSDDGDLSRVLMEHPLHSCV